MNLWTYEVRDKDTDVLLLTEGGFETESDAETQAIMEAKLRNIKNFCIRTLQKWEDM